MPGSRRRVHRKTRTGCKGCKQQRKKCDEKTPTCSNCNRRGLSCSLSNFSMSLPCLDTCTSTPAELDLMALDLKTLELFHHYTAVTSLTLSIRSRASFWQIQIPRLAFENSFIMHGMLAVSALHLASLQPLRRSELLLRAAVSENLALMSYREYIAVPNETTVHAALAFGAFVIPYVFTLSTSDPSSASGGLPTLNAESPHWFFLVRGIILLVNRTWSTLQRGPFGPMLTTDSEPVDHATNPDDHHFSRLRSLFENSKSQDVVDVKNREILIEALDTLRGLAILPFVTPKRKDLRSTLYLWPGLVSQEYIELLHHRHPEALVLLAYYCVIVKQNDNRWFLKGVGDRMLIEIEKVLSKEWKAWIAWAIEYPSQRNED